MPEQTQIPRVLWAQQREHVLLTIAVPDIEKVDVKFEEDSVSFQGQPKASNAKDTMVYAVKVDLFEKIDPATSKYENIGQKFWRLLLTKKDSGTKFWPRLTKEKARLHWLQTDFDHWKDEDESDDEKGGFNGNFQNMFDGGMGGLGDMGMGGLGDMGMGDMPDMEEDSDDEENNADNQQAPTSENNDNDSTTKSGEQEQST